MSIKNQIKKALCKAASYYEDGKLIVPAGRVISYGLMCSAIGGLLLWFLGILLWEIYTDTINGIAVLVSIILIIMGVLLSVWLFAKFISWTGISKLVKRLEITCDLIVFPEEVKAIFAQVEALDDEKKSFFLKGIHPLLRKMGEE